jgi:hypothetical protein
MINDHNKIEIIDLYLDDALPEKLRREVEERMRNDYSFRNEVEIQRKVIAMIRQDQREEMKKETNIIFESDEKATADSNVINLRGRSRYYAIAASVGLAILAAALFFFTQNTEPEVSYLAVSLPDGARGSVPENISLQMPVLIFTDHDEYQQHYQLGDTLRLYGNFDPEELSLEYEPNQKIYLLTTGQATFSLSPTNTTKPLLP